MAFVYGDRVKETSLTIGTGPMVLGGATVGFVDFVTGVGLGNECFYGIINTIDNTWEMGRGTVSAGTLSRDTIFSSLNADAIVNFGVGDKLVYTTIPEVFYAGALDSAKHELEDHTVAPLNLLDATAHEALDHTAAPLNLLTAPAHELIDHTIAPFNLLNTTSHEAVDHTAAPLSLLDATAHEAVDHTLSPFFLLDVAAHLALDHAPVLNNNPPQISVPERTAGTATALRSFSPLDVSTMAGIFGGGGGGGGLQVATFSPSTFTWVASNSPIDTTPLGFTPLVAIAFGSFHHSPGTLTAGNASTLSVGIAVSGNSYSHGQNSEVTSDGNDDNTTYAVGSIGGVSALGTSAFKSAWDLATINVNQFTAAGIILQPSAALTGNITLIVLG